jgi:transposase
VERNSQSFTYAEFRRATGLTKKEADRWVQAGVIQAGPAAGHRREYRYESIFEGLIAKQLADFSSRELLPKTMVALRAFLMNQRVSLTRVLDDSDAHRLVKIYTRRSKELMPGGGVRGVVSYIDWYDPTSAMIGKAVYVVVDLRLVILEALTAVAHLPSR